MKKILFTLFGIFIALNVNGQDKTDYPMFSYDLDEYNGTATIVIEPVDPETDAIYWRVMFEDEEWTEWMIYDGPICFNAMGRYQLQTYATSPGKIDSDIVCIEFEIYEPTDPNEIYHVQIADFGVNGIYYKYTSDSTVCVSLNDTYDYPYAAPYGWEEYSVGPYSGDVVIPPTVEYGGRTYTVEGIDRFAFINCPLTSITLPNTIKYISNRAFVHATIESGSIFIPASVTTVEPGAFADCYNINVQVDENNPIYDSRDNCNAIIETATNTLAVAFNTSTIPSSVAAIGKDAFAGDAYTGHGYFPGCTISDLVIPNSVQDIANRAFYMCDISKITLSEELTTIGDWAFFQNSFRSLIIPNSVTKIGVGAFAYCIPMASVTISNSVTTIDDQTFMGCSALTSVDIPNSVTSIGDEAFDACTSLTSINIPNSVISIGTDAFSRCVELTNVTIGNSVTSIGTGAFGNNKNLRSIFCHAIIPPSAQGICNSYYNNTYDQATLFVPADALEAYRAHAEWGKFQHIVPFIGAGPGDINGDGNVAINDVTNLIDMLLSGDELPAWADVDGDGEVTIKDITVLIDMLLNGNN